jgi:hypothetical protein
MKRILAVLLFGILPLLAFSQSIPTPKSHLGFDIGEPYKLATFSELEAYFKKVDAASDRVLYTSIGQTEFGKEHPMLIITSPKNFSQLERYKEISQKLGRAEITQEEAKALAKEGKPIIWIDGGLHSLLRETMRRLSRYSTR